jgi:hypothetical protein
MSRSNRLKNTFPEPIIVIVIPNENRLCIVKGFPSRRCRKANHRSRKQYSSRTSPLNQKEPTHDKKWVFV